MAERYGCGVGCCGTGIFSGYCSEFLVHAVDVEGRAEESETELVELLGEFNQLRITYAGGCIAMRI